MSEEKKVVDSQKEVNELVEKGLVALEQFRLLNQEQVDYIVAKASVAALDQHGVLALHAVVVEYLKIKRLKIYLHVNTSFIICVIRKPLELLKMTK